jgi:hypothetical protein
MYGPAARYKMASKIDERESCINVLEPIRKDWIHDEAFAASRLSMMRIMARRMKAVTVVA